MRKPAARGWRLRLWHRLAAIVALAALLPVAGVAPMAMRLVISGLESGVREQANRTLRVALNLILGQVKELFENAEQVSEMAGLPDALAEALADASAGDSAEARPDASTLADGRINLFLANHEQQLPHGLVEIADASGVIVGRRAVGGQPGLEGFSLADRAGLIGKAIGYERRVTIDRVGDKLVMRRRRPSWTIAFTCAARWWSACRSARSSRIG